MTINQILKALYATYLTNSYGFKLKKVSTKEEKKELRLGYAQTLLDALKIKVEVINKEKIPQDGKYLLVSNHRSVIDPLIIELATRESKIFGYWVAKKELANSFFFGVFVRNAGTILLDREDAKMGDFFSNIKKCVKDDTSVYIFPEGTRNKTENDLGEFKEGSKIIALKNRLPILPVYIQSNANQTLMDSLKDGKQTRVIKIEIGDMIEYKDRTPLVDNYKKQFHLS